MNPHRMTWGFAYDFPFAPIIAVTTLAGFVLSTEAKRLPITTTCMLMIATTMWCSITTIFALEPPLAYDKWLWVIKVLIFTFIAMILINDRRRIVWFVWVIVGCLSYFGIKGGVFSVINGFDFKVWGPPSSFIEDNNFLALALIMTLPLMRFLQLGFESKYAKLAMGVAMALNLASIVGSHSRGAFLACGVVAVILCLKSRHKFVFGAVGMIALVGTLAMAPKAWYDRMATIQDYEQESSANARLDSWTFSYRVALDRPVIGGGFGVYTDAQYQKYYSEYLMPWNAHSSYFEIMAEHGFVGLFLFMAVLGSAYMSAGRTRKWAKNNPETRWLSDLSAMLQVSLAGYAVGAVFLNVAFSDLYWHMLALVVICAQQRLVALAPKITSSSFLKQKSSAAPAPAADTIPAKGAALGGASGFLIERG